MKRQKPGDKLENCYKRINSHHDSQHQESPKTPLQNTNYLLKQQGNLRKSGKTHTMEEDLGSRVLSFISIKKRLSYFLLQVSWIAKINYQLFLLHTTQLSFHLQGPENLLLPCVSHYLHLLVRVAARFLKRLTTSSISHNFTITSF